MKKKDIGMMLTVLVLGAVLLGTAVPAQAAEPPASTMAQAEALKVSSYKGNSLAVGDRSMVVISPYGTSVTAVSSNPEVIALEQVRGWHVMAAKAPGTAIITIMDEAGNTADMTVIVSGEETSSAPPQAAASSKSEDQAADSPIINSEWSHNPDADLAANMEIRLEMVRLINEVRQKHGLAELPVDDRLMNATQDVSTQHFREHTQYEREAVIAYGWLYGGCHNLTCFNMASDGDIARRAVTNWVNSPGHLQSMLREDVTCIGVGVTIEDDIAYCHMFAGDPTGHGIL